MYWILRKPIRYNLMKIQSFLIALNTGKCYHISLIGRNYEQYKEKIVKWKFRNKTNITNTTNKKGSKSFILLKGIR